MEASLTLWALLTRLAIGLFALQILLERELLGKLFFRVNAWISAGLLSIALAFRLPALLSPAASSGPSEPGGPAGQAGVVLYFGCLVLILAYLMALRRPRAGWIDRLQRLFVPVGLAALALDSIATIPWDAGGVLGPIAAVTSSMLLGSTVLAMMLGHWYLVIANLSIHLLARATLAFIAAVILRTAAVGASLAFLPGEAVEDLYGGGVIFLTLRLLFGLLGPLLISVLIWKTVKIRSTQSATGLLYVAVAFVLVGEMVASYLLFADDVPV